MFRSEEGPEGPLCLGSEVRPISLHRVVQLVIAPQRAGTGAHERHTAAGRGLDLEPGSFEDALNLQVLDRQRSRSVRMSTSVDLSQRRHAFGEVEFKIHIAEMTRCVPEIAN